ncbi:TIGR00645 family protein [Salinisphaera sp.]|uniref:TIGR00645 family protein n=1 Tax=Salinisphaera sp. TaxID=1914330 RepID=UPI000C3CC4E3|nr:hypothetical protein [Salinisphaera sp.]
MANRLEMLMERMIYGSRWVLAPIYVGLSLALLALGVKFFQEVLTVLPQLFTIKETDLVLLVLTLIDLALVGGLIVMVMLSSYETFVSRLNLAEEDDKLPWLGRMDYTSLKNKVASSIVAISSIHLLKVFMNTPNIGEGHLMWYVIIHLTFVLSAFAMGILDRLTRHD